MRPISITCGIFLFYGNELLICHPSGASMGNWSIPKGIKEENESFLQAAIRELFEETNLNILDYTDAIKDIGEIEYRTKKKKLHGFISFCNKNRPEDLQCNSLTSEGKPEVNIINWTKITLAFKLLHESQQKLLKFFLENYNSETENDIRIQALQKLLF